MFEGLYLICLDVVGVTGCWLLFDCGVVGFGCSVLLLCLLNCLCCGFSLWPLHWN